MINKPKKTNALELKTSVDKNCGDLCHHNGLVDCRYYELIGYFNSSSNDLSLKSLGQKSVKYGDSKLSPSGG